MSARSPQVAHGSALGLQLCEALGLDPHLVVNLTFEADCNSPASVRIVRLLTVDEVASVTAEMKRFAVVEREPELDAPDLLNVEPIVVVVPVPSDEDG